MTSAIHAGIGSLAGEVIDARLTYLDVPKFRTLEACVREVERDAVAGDFLEMGIALGGSAIVLASELTRGRRFHGYDVFGMIPPPSDADPPPVHERYRVISERRSKGIGGDVYYGYVDDLYGRVMANFADFGIRVDGDRVRLHRGLFEETLFPDAPVALAHVDCDWYEPIKLCIERTWPWLSHGGLMVFDDYNDYGGCTRAVDEFTAHTENATLRSTEANAVLVKSRPKSV